VIRKLRVGPDTIDRVNDRVVRGDELLEQRIELVLADLDERMISDRCVTTIAEIFEAENHGNSAKSSSAST
jgi:hypothetical protein